MRHAAPAVAFLVAPALSHAAEPENLAERFVAAWDAHRPEAFAVLYTLDAVWVSVAEQRTAGRADIVAEFAKIHIGGRAAKTTIAMKDRPKVRLVRPDVATIFFHMDFMANGRPVPAFREG